MASFKHRTLLTTALFLAATGTAAADETDKERKLDAVKVTGQVLYSDRVNALRTPTPIIDVPQSLSIISADEIATRGFDSIEDIINYTPGVNTSQGEGHRDAVVFRGVRSTADFFIDGVRDDVQYYRPLYNLEQVEILRGPNALLFGRGGTGGILNRVTKKADARESFTGYQASLDTFGAFGASVDYNVVTGDGAAFRVNAMYENLQNHRDFYDGERFGINPTFGFDIGDSTRLDVSYEYIDHERFIDRGIPTGANGEPVEAFTDIVFGDPSLNTHALKANIMRANLQHKFSDNLKGNFSAFYGDYDKLYENFYAASYDETTEPTRVGLDGYVDTTQRQNAILSGNLIGEFETGSLAHTLIIGAEYIDTQNNNDRFNPVWSDSNDDVEFFTITRPLNLVAGNGVAFNGNPTSVAFSDLNDDTEAEVDVFSFYVQDEIEVSPKFDVVIGARFDSFDITVDNLDPSNLETRSRKDEEVSPRLGLIYKPMENISVYASYSETFLPRSGGQFANINGNNNALDPNTFTNLEGGVKWDFMDALSLTAAIFEIEQSSPQVADSDPATLDVIDSQTTGFEVQLQGYITDNWFVSTGYSYLDGEQVSRSGPTGLRPRELPENMFSIWNAYQITEQFGVGIGASYQDETFINNSNTATLPAYTRLDAAAYYDVSDTLRLQLNVENLTDETYFPNAHATHQATVGAPLNARFTISGKF